MYVCACLCEFRWTMHMQVPSKVKNTGSSKTRVTGGCGLPEMGARSQTWLFHRRNKHFKPLSPLSSPSAFTLLLLHNHEKVTHKMILSHLPVSWLPVMQIKIKLIQTEQHTEGYLQIYMRSSQCQLSIGQIS